MGESLHRSETRTPLPRVPGRARRLAPAAKSIGHYRRICAAEATETAEADGHCPRADVLVDARGRKLAPAMSDVWAGNASVRAGLTAGPRVVVQRAAVDGGVEDRA